MILVDTSVWVEHLRSGNQSLMALLEEGQVLMHPFVEGELACGNLRKRSEILELLRRLPAAVEAKHDEVLTLIERHALMGRGLGYVDMHLLAATFLTPDARLWSFDKRLAAAAEAMALS